MGAKSVPGDRINYLALSIEGKEAVWRRRDHSIDPRIKFCVLSRHS